MEPAVVRHVSIALLHHQQEPGHGRQCIYRLTLLNEQEKDPLCSDAGADPGIEKGGSGNFLQKAEGPLILGGSKPRPPGPLQAVMSFILRSFYRVYMDPIVILVFVLKSSASNLN